LINTSPEDEIIFHFETSSHVDEIAIDCHIYTMFVNGQLIYQLSCTSLFHISFIEFVVTYDIKIFKIYQKKNVSCWVSFNKHKNLENHYRELLFLFSPFIMNEMSQKQTYSIWHDAYKTKELSIQTDTLPIL
jgi:hypothetical protein